MGCRIVSVSPGAWLTAAAASFRSAWKIVRSTATSAQSAMPTSGTSEGNVEPASMQSVEGFHCIIICQGFHEFHTNKCIADEYGLFAPFVLSTLVVDHSYLSCSYILFHFLRSCTSLMPLN